METPISEENNPIHFELRSHPPVDVIGSLILSSASVFITPPKYPGLSIKQRSG
ncbi:MAG: hypothetical protein WBA93_00745 [Microcoleaceae cyanobacterium]